MAIPLPAVEGELESRLGQMGFELVTAEWAGSRGRPILRVRLDLPESIPGESGVTVDQCAEVSRALEPWLDEHPDIPERYVLEVSSPGVNRPLVRRTDWIRFRGRTVGLVREARPGEEGGRLEGEILGLEERETGEALIVLRLEDGEEVHVPLDRVKKANLVFEWD